MLQSNLKLFALLMTLVTFLVIGISKHSAVQSTAHSLEVAQQTRATLIAQVDLIITRSELNDRQGLSQFLNELESLNGLAGWTLTDENNQVLGQRRPFENNNQSQQYLYFHRDLERQKLMSLQLVFDQPKVATGWSLWDFFVAGLAVIAMTLCLFLIFKWVLNLENYANYLLTDNKSFNRSQFKNYANPVSRIINQLILQNSLLEKDKQELTDQIRKTSYVDDVTELGNHQFFKAEFQVRLHNHEEEESGLFVLLSFVERDDDDELVIDDDRLRQITHVIKQYASEIPSALVARLHANDFALLLPNRTRSETDKICKTVIEQLEKIVFDKTSIREHFVDIGISAYKQGFDYYKIMAEADMALRNAQLQGGNNWFMFGETLPESKVRGHMKWRSFLQRILDRRQIQLYGQQVNYFTKESKSHHEVLVRIEDGKDILTAESFLPMASNCGLSTAFDRQVVDGVIKHCLYQEGPKDPPIYSINLFITSLLDEPFVSWFVEKFSSYPELSKRIEVEITESNINQYTEALTRVMNRFADIGIQCCVEHFGSPEQNLAYLDALPISRVKVDRRIIFGIHENREQQLLLKTMLINLKSKGIKVIAEGVEQAEDAEFITQAGLDGAQGFYYSKPQRLKTIEKFLKAV
ncbi:EAL domain-containing protein [Aliikangiella marina]|uniref:EAL domain-containing protein n=1 Tax=Aliikangiella marina TaxID=1712262 RepID=A0A545T6U4_9GAMM|nr:EAL domain-containing protein [Aliikangiella marina]TQV72905.1 EAL domain-containing protein [Aliikangiella marina]